MITRTFIALALLVCGCDRGGTADAHSNSDMSSSSTPPDGATSDAASASDGGVPLAPLWPLDVGHSWTYNVRQLGSASPCQTGLHSATVTGQTVISGRTAIRLVEYCSLLAPQYLSVIGDRVDLLSMGNWIAILDTPVADGHSWRSTGSIEYTWHDAGSVTVPAGTFSQCWSATQQVAYTAYLIFCRGIGLVREYSRDLNGNGWDAELTGKNF